MSIETLLTLDKAERMTTEQLRDEAARCTRGIQVAANATAKKRFQTRLAVFLEEIRKREGERRAA